MEIITRAFPMEVASEKNRSTKMMTVIRLISTTEGRKRKLGGEAEFGGLGRGFRGVELVGAGEGGVVEVVCGLF